MLRTSMGIYPIGAQINLAEHQFARICQILTIEEAIQLPARNTPALVMAAQGACAGV